MVSCVLLIDSWTTDLALLFVDEAARRKGIAAALIQWGCKEADKRGLTSFVEASIAGQPSYQKQGFESDEKVDLKFDHFPQRKVITYFFMVREPEKEQ